jgi:PAS domain S-box-containing protein
MGEEIKVNRGRVINFEGPAMRKDGSLIEIWMTLFGVYDHSGKLLGTSSFLRDITERKRAEREHALLAALVQTTDDAIVSLSTDMRIISWNQGAQKLLGYAAEEVLGQRPVDLYIPAADRAKVEAEFGSILASVTESSAGHPVEAQMLRKDGTTVDVTMVDCGIRDPGGKLLGLSSIMRDVSGRIRAERDEARYAAIVRASNDAIMNVSSEAKIESWNPAAEQLYGYTAQEAIGQGIGLFVLPEELPQTIATTRQVVETGKPTTWEQKGRRRDGTPFVCEVSIFPIRDADGRVTGVAGIGRNITRLKEVERELRESARELVSARERRLRRRKRSRNFCRACRTRFARQ